MGGRGVYSYTYIGGSAGGLGKNSMKKEKKDKDPFDRPDGKLPNAEKATIADAKIYEYLLKHREKDDKSKYMKDVLGYSNETGEQLMQELLDGARNNLAEFSRVNEVGRAAYNVYTELGIKRRHLVNAVWYINPDTMTPYFVTLYPADKE